MKNRAVSSIRDLCLGALLLFLHTQVVAQTSQERPKVITTVSPITNIVQNIGGIHVQVIGIVPDGTDFSYL